MSKFKAFHVRETGASHLKNGKSCQDYAVSSDGREFAVALVCDGHGGDKYFRSERGSRIAGEQTMEAICEFMRNRFRKSQGGIKVVDTLLANPENFMRQLAANIIFRWREAIVSDYNNEPFSEQEMDILTDKERTALLLDDGWVTAYGTTLIAAVRAKTFWFGLHIGDGKCVTVSHKGEFLQPIPWDDKCFLNVTTSLCDTEALSRFRYFFASENLPDAIFLGTDGVDDTFGTDDSLHNFYKTVLKLFEENGMGKGKEELQAYLPKLSAKGSQDDISIAGILAINGI